MTSSDPLRHTRGFDLSLSHKSRAAHALCRHSWNFQLRLPLMKHCLILIAAWACPLLGAAQAAAAPQPEIILDQASVEIFPESWRGGEVNANAKPLAPSQVKRLRRIIDRALAKYPQALLESTLVKLYGLGHLEYHGVATGGTRSADSIYVVCKPTYTDAAVERIIHAEYSSLLFHEHHKDFDSEAWKRQNAQGAVYLGSGVAAVKAGKTSSEMKPELNEQGFVSEYAQASLEEDFNSHAARLFMGEDAYWRALEKYPRLKAKAELVMNFYMRLNREFSPARFAAMRTDESTLTLAGIFTDKKFEEKKVPKMQWSSLGSYYWTLEPAAKEKESQDLVRVEAASGQRRVVVTAEQMTPKGEKKPLSLSEFRFSADEKQLLIFTNTKKVWRKNTRGDYWLLNLDSKKLEKLGGEAKPSTLMFAKFSPDGSKVAFVKENNLYVQSLESGKIQPMTSDGSAKIINGTADWVNEEELDLRDCFRWSPDGEKILFWRFDTTGVKEFSLINQTDDAYPSITTFPYPKAGETNSAVKLGVVRVADQSTVWLKIPGDAREHYLPAAEWTPDASQVIVQQFNRQQNTLIVMRCDPGSGECQPFFTETDKAWIENKNQGELQWLQQDFLWLSERSGWRRVYRVNPQGELLPITPDEQDVIEIVAVDARRGWVYYLASPHNATQRQLHRANVNGEEDQQITPLEQTGTHSYEFSEDTLWAVHTYSNFTTPPVVDLVSMPKHQTVRVMEDQKELRDKLAQVTQPKTAFHRIQIEPQVEVDAWMITAADLDAKVKHPLLIHVYGEPAGQTVKDAWGGQRLLWHWMLAQQGYVVASVDTRGTPAPKGRAWRKAIYRQLGILNSQEEALAVRTILQRFDFLDPKRVGIWGWSGGGSSSLDAIFRYPDLYQVAIAVAPVADRKLYDSIYEERYMGLPKDNPDGYKNGSPITHASGLEGDLLIIHGTGDDNVHYQGVEKLMNELIRLNKPFSVMPYPNRDHSINTGEGTSRHLYETMTSFLNRHLLEAE